MDRKIDITKNKEYYKKKRNNILFFVFGPFFIVVSIYLALTQFSNIDKNVILNIVLPIIIVNVFFVIKTTNKSLYYNMKYLYYRMKEDQLGIVNIKKKLFTKKWLNDFLVEGYKLARETTSYIIYYRFPEKLKMNRQKNDILECVIVAKVKSLDFYSEEIDKEIDQILIHNNRFKQTKKIVVLQYKRYEAFSESTEKDIDSIICFSNRFHFLVNVTVGYFEKDNQVYFLTPKTKYPNKYYYYACQQIKKQVGMIE